ncbi:MAG TPA: AAA family ATPase [Tepidisphaeraceae bacterium]|jgi:predicted kinase|nr:AAA family ATPase [Tepidisphaeraceae bacterium]
MLSPRTKSWTFPHCPTPPDWRLDFAALVAQFDWLRIMGTCPQDPQWHAEGDVLTHVGMVCRELTAMLAWRALPETERNIVFAGALLHDAAKPRLTKEEDGHLRSRGHSLAGMRMARRILGDEIFGPGGTPFHVREQICALVRYHGLPGTLLEKADSQRVVITASMTARCDLVAILAEADTRGRICPGLDQAIERVQLFRDFAGESSCLSGPYPFASAASRFRYFRTPGAPPTIDVYDATRCTVTLMCGLPASGKDTWVKQNAGDAPVISLDALRTEMDVDPSGDQGPVIRAAKEQAKAYLRENRGFIWNATNTTRMLRDGLIDLFTAYNARVRIVYCEAPMNDIRRRNAARKVPVPMRVIEKLMDHLDVPDLAEAQEVEYSIASDK